MIPLARSKPRGQRGQHGRCGVAERHLPGGSWSDSPTKSTTTESGRRFFGGGRFLGCLVADAVPGGLCVLAHFCVLHIYICVYIYIYVYIYMYIYIYIFGGGGSLILESFAIGIMEYLLTS